MNGADLIALIPAGGAAGVLAFVVLALLNGWLVPGYLYDRLQRQNAELINAALSSNSIAELALKARTRRKAVEVAERL